MEISLQRQNHPLSETLIGFLGEKSVLKQASTWGRVCRQKPVVSELQREPAPVCSPATGTCADLSNSCINIHVLYIRSQKTSTCINTLSGRLKIHVFLVFYRFQDNTEGTNARPSQRPQLGVPQ